MRWQKLGLLYAPDGRLEWAQAGALIPTPVALSEDLIRIYVAHLDQQTIGRIGHVDVALSDPTHAVASAAEPVLDIGEPGDFDDNGVVPCCALRVGSAVWLYYSGYQQQKKIPYTIFSNLAIASSPDGPFERVSKTPILDRTAGERFFRAAPFVMRDDGRWRMWYIGGGGWVHWQGKGLPNYTLRYTESADGVAWSSDSRELLIPQGPDEIAFGRPFIVRTAAEYCMWYSVRTVVGYTLGYATSRDGLQWTRRDSEVGIARAESGWDSEMTCYSAVIPAGNRWLLFYNGNGYGRTGLGAAIAEPDPSSGR